MFNHSIPPSRFPEQCALSSTPSLPTCLFLSLSHSHLMRIYPFTPSMAACKRSLVFILFSLESTHVSYATFLSFSHFPHSASKIPQILSGPSKLFFTVGCGWMGGTEQPEQAPNLAAAGRTGKAVNTHMCEGLQIFSPYSQMCREDVASSFL